MGSPLLQVWSYWLCLCLIDFVCAFAPIERDLRFASVKNRYVVLSRYVAISDVKRLVTLVGVRMVPRYSSFLALSFNFISLHLARFTVGHASFSKCDFTF